MIAPEVNFSHAICDYILAKGYTRIYLTENLARADRVRESLEYGFKTTTLTKPPIISGLRALLNEAPTSIRDRAFWYEAEYYILMDVARNIMNAVFGLSWRYDYGRRDCLLCIMLISSQTSIFDARNKKY